MFFFGILPFVFMILLFNVLRMFRKPTRNPTEIMFTPERQVPQAREDGNLFRLAKKLGGRVTLSEVVVETGMDLKVAERYMDSLVDEAHVTVEVDDMGRVIYVFPELMGENE